MALGALGKPLCPPPGMRALIHLFHHFLRKAFPHFEPDFAKRAFIPEIVGFIGIIAEIVKLTQSSPRQTE